MRIDQLLAHQPNMSKRKSKQLLVAKQVTVNGQVVTNGSLNVDPLLQEVCVARQKIRAVGHVYYMLNKPAGVVSAVVDATHQTVLDCLKPEDRRPRLHPVGRLDRDTEGLVLLTDNGQLSYQLAQAKKQIWKTYEVYVNGLLTEDDRVAFANGIEFLDGTRCQPAKLTIVQADSAQSQALVAISEGKFHQIKKMFLACGKKVVFLKRLSIGPLVLDEHLPSGAYRPLNTTEIQALLPYFVSHQKKGAPA